MKLNECLAIVVSDAKESGLNIAEYMESQGIPQNVTFELWAICVICYHIANTNNTMENPNE